MSFRRFRILILLGLLAAAGSLTFLEQWMARSWHGPLDVQIIPVNGDGSAQADATIAALDAGDFGEINAFLERELARYGAPLSPAIHVTLQPPLAEAPPAPPAERSALNSLAWSLKLRGWVYRQSGQWLPQLGTVKLFLLYHTAQDGVALEHSLGLQKGLIGVIHVFADAEQQRQNAIVIAHELLHTLGASDKYAEGGPAGVSRRLRGSRSTAVGAAPGSGNHGGALRQCRRWRGDAGEPRSVRDRAGDRTRNQSRRGFPAALQVRRVAALN